MKINTLWKLLLALMPVILVSQLFVVNTYAARDNQAPQAPTDLIASFLTSNSVTLTWKEAWDNVGVTSYIVYKNNATIGNTNTLSYEAGGLSSDTQYTFYIKAKDAAGNISRASKTWTVTTLPDYPPTSKFYRVGYYTSWSAYNDFTPDKISAAKLTHINYAFANIGSDLKIALGDATIDPTNFARLNAVKKYSPNLKTLISVGGWSWSGKFSDVASPQNQSAFADSCSDYIVNYGFDGVDIDWEYPVSGGMSTNTTRPDDKRNFTTLLKTLRDSLDAKAKVVNQTDPPHYLLTIAAGAGPDFFNNTEMASLIQYLDFVNLMTYDIHGGWDKYTDFNAPLKTDSLSPLSQSKWSIDNAVNLWLGTPNNIPANKIVIGIPFYGKKYGSVKSTNSYPTNFPGLYQTYGRCTTVTYQEILKNYNISTGYTRYFYGTAGVPYLFNGSTFISYDDPPSIPYKTSYIKTNALGGAMVWELSQDNNNELINAVYNGLK